MIEEESLTRERKEDNNPKTKDVNIESLTETTIAAIDQGRTEEMNEETVMKGIPEETEEEITKDLITN